jgi:ferrous iron transport protein A
LQVWACPFVDIRALNLTDLKKGQKAVISRIVEGSVKRKLMEMGCIPGQEITLKLIAPFGDPLAFDISGYCLSMRRKEASSVEIIMVDK